MGDQVTVDRTRPTWRPGRYPKVFVLILLSSCFTAQADELDQIREFHIGAQALDAALIEFSEQAGVQLMVPTALVAGLQSSGVTGEYAANNALTLLLAGNDLTFQAIGEDTVAVSKTNEGKAPGKRRPTSGPRLMAQASATRDQGTRTDATRMKKVENLHEAGFELDEIVVTGTRIRGVETANPSITVDRNTIDSAGFNTVVDVFDNLPQNLGELGVGAGPTGASRIASESPDRATGVSLRGLGPQSTLVLVNGRRYPGAVSGRVVDISAIPLAAVERVEVLTGGASALYGSDAVAGVVNVITRRSFEGIEAQAFYGLAGEGADRFQASLVAGIDAERGGFVLGYDHSRDWSLDVTDAGVVGVGPSGLAPVAGRHFIQPNQRRHAVFTSGRYELTDRVVLYADGSYAYNKSEALSELSFAALPSLRFGADTSVESDQYVATVGTSTDLGGDWTLDLSATHGVREADVKQLVFLDQSRSQTRDDSELSYVSAVFDGKLFTLNGLNVLSAFGAEYRHEGLKQFRPITGVVRGDVDRSVRSVFGEIRIPLAEQGERKFLHRFELSLAARYDDYSDFGETSDPQIGIIWAPTDALTFRGSFATAFRAPSLFLQALRERSSTQAILRTLVDPTVPGGSSPTLVITGVADGTGPEEAETFTLGIDYDLPVLENTRVSLSYFDISYEDRIDEPAVGFDLFGILSNEDAFGDLVDRNPDEATLRAFYEAAIATSATSYGNTTGRPFDPESENFLDVFPELVLVDNRRANIGVEDVSGLDFQIISTVQTDLGELSFGVNGLYYLNFERAITPVAPFVALDNAPGKPVDFRFRADAGWRSGPWAATVFVNYMDSYTDTFADPEVEVDVWTTVDLTLRFDGSEQARYPILDGISATLAVDNLLDEAPPFFGSDNFGINYDRANADARGRFVSLQMRKRW